MEEIMPEVRVLFRSILRVSKPRYLNGVAAPQLG